MLNWLHHLLNPHCPHCLEEAEDKKFCKSCEVLSRELERAYRERDLLLEKLLEKPSEVVSKPPEEMKPILPRGTHIPWNTRRQMLETEDREKARIIREKSVEEAEIKKLRSEDIKSTEELLGVDNAS